MDTPPGSWKDLRWIEPQTRWMLAVFFKRKLDVMTESARRTANWSTLALDAIVLYAILRLL
jgi:hypothetical protein